MDRRDRRAGGPVLDRGCNARPGGGQSVDTADRDRCALIVVTNWRGSGEAQQEQQFFVHAGGRLGRLHPEAAAEAVVLHAGGFRPEAALCS